MTNGDERPRMLLVGGGGGFVGRAVLEEFAPDWAIRSVHRTVAATEEQHAVEWLRGDVGTFADWDGALEGVDLVVNLAWYRQGSDRRFAALTAGLMRLLEAASRRGIRRFVQLSVPEAPAALEQRLPYLVHRRTFDLALEASRISHVTVRPTMLFGPRDKLLTVMMRQIRRYRRFPMFGDGEYHVSPISVYDLAHILRWEAGRPGSRIVRVGGPDRWRYRDLTDRIFSALGLPPRYWTVSPANAVRLATVLESMRSSLLYAYEVRWLLSDMLGLPPYEGLDRPLRAVEPFLDAEASR